MPPGRSALRGQVLESLGGADLEGLQGGRHGLLQAGSALQGLGEALSLLDGEDQIGLPAAAQGLFAGEQAQIQDAAQLIIAGQQSGAGEVARNASGPGFARAQAR